jgi:hypothetical protein
VVIGFLKERYCGVRDFHEMTATDTSMHMPLLLECDDPASEKPFFECK